MSYVDLQPVLASWRYDPDRISARKIVGSDGAIKIQLRVELGLLQMDSCGRPDGRRPSGTGSLLEHQRQRLTDYERRSGTSIGFGLTPEECEALQDEASLYYRRFVALFVLEEYEGVIADTTHALAILDLCRDSAIEGAWRSRLEPFRPYVMMMDARARALDALGKNQHAAALAHVNRGLVHLTRFQEHRGRSARREDSEEFRILRTLRSEIVQEIPGDSTVGTRRALREAVLEERFEDAARLRDRLRAPHAARDGESAPAP